MTCSGFRKSMHNLMSPFFLRTHTRFATHYICRTRKMIRAANNLLNSTLTVGSRLGCIFHNFCCTSLTPIMIGITCCMIRVSKVFKSSYDHANMSLYSLNNLVKETFLSSEHCTPRLMFWGLSGVPKLITSYWITEL